MLLFCLDQPKLFLKSELELYASLEQLYEIPAYPEFYPALISSNVLNYLIDLILHENQDIVIKVLELLRELFQVDESEPNVFQHYSKLISEFVKPERAGLESLIDNVNNQVGRLKDSNLRQSEQDQIENVISSSCLLVQEFFSFNSILVEYFLNRTEISKLMIESFVHPVKKLLFESSLPTISNLLLSCCQESYQFCLSLMNDKYAGKSYLDYILITLSKFIVSDYVSSSDEEFSENLFESLATALSYSQIQNEVQALEGPALLLKLIKTRHSCYISALKCLKAFALHNMDGCKHLVQIGMLKVLFPVLNNKGIKRKRKNGKFTPKLLVEDAEIEELVVSIFYQCFVLFEENAIELGRLCFKFKEKHFLNSDRLIELLKLLVTRYQKNKLESKDVAEEEADILEATSKLSKHQAEYLLDLNAGYEGIEQLALIVGRLICLEKAFYLHFKQAIVESETLAEYSIKYLGKILEKKANFLSNNVEKDADLSIDKNRCKISKMLFSVAAVLQKEEEWSKT